MLQKKDENDLLKWFNLDNYQTIEKLNALEWIENLKLRYRYFSLFNLPLERYPSDEQENPYKKHTAEKVIQTILKQPIIRLSDQVCNQDVQNISYGHLIEHLLSMRNCDNQSFEYILKEMYSTDDSDLTPDHLKTIQEGLYDKHFLNNESNIACLSVDLYATDKQLRDEFDSWLAQIRKKNIRTRRTKFGDKHFKNWTEFKVLPYLDIIIWSHFNKITPPGYEKIGETLYPSKENSSNDLHERIRKTTKPKAFGLMKQETFQKF